MILVSAASNTFEIRGKEIRDYQRRSCQHSGGKLLRRDRFAIIRLAFPIAILEQCIETHVPDDIEITFAYLRSRKFVPGTIGVHALDWCRVRHEKSRTALDDVVRVVLQLMGLLLRGTPQMVLPRVQHASAQDVQRCQRA